MFYMKGYDRPSEWNQCVLDDRAARASKGINRWSEIRPYKISIVLTWVECQTEVMSVAARQFSWSRAACLLGKCEL